MLIKVNFLMILTKQKKPQNNYSTINLFECIKHHKRPFRAIFDF